MRVLGLTLILATLGLVAAQNSTASDDAYQCAFQCGELAGRDHQAAAQQCAKETDTNKATACLCNTPDLINEVDACMRQTCPSAVPALEAQCRTLSGSRKAADVFPFLVGSGAVLAGMLML